ncbi:hypothetical protein ACED96_06790 [Clostridium thermobutyricum]
MIEESSVAISTKSFLDKVFNLSKDLDSSNILEVIFSDSKSLITLVSSLSNAVVFMKMK